MDNKSGTARNARQLKILELIAQKDIETQDELAAELLRENFPVTQATISRDIKELGLVKVSDGKKQKYAREYNDYSISNKILNMFRHAVYSVDYALNIAVIKTISGAANSAGMFVDRMNFGGVMGCVAGDDTLMVITKSEAVAHDLVEELNEILRG